MSRRLVIWGGGILAVILIVIFVLAYLIDEPLRRKVERDMNARLKGYTVRVEKLDFHPIGLSLDLEKLWIYQTPHPDPPIAYIPNLHASVHWKALLFGRLVGDFQIEDPKVHIDLRQFVQESKDPTPIQDKGWQDALEAAYPLKIDRFAIRNGDLTYVDKGPYKPLHVRKLNFTAENIRNVKSAKGVYPSPVDLEGVVFDKGNAKFKGDVDFLAKPHIALKGDLELGEITLDYFKPIAERYKLSVRTGSLSTRGSIEYAPDVQKIMINNLSLTGLDADYLHQETQTAPTEKVTKEAGKVARETANEPTLEVKVERFTADGRIGFVNQAAKPPYNVFLDGTRLQLENLSNHFKEGPARARVTGRFMGSGPTQVQATFRPESKGPDLDLTLSIENTDMRRMNDPRTVISTWLPETFRRGCRKLFSVFRNQNTARHDRRICEASFQRHESVRSASGRREKHVSKALRGAGRGNLRTAAKSAAVRGRDKSADFRRRGSASDQHVGDDCPADPKRVLQSDPVRI